MTPRREGPEALARLPAFLAWLRAELGQLRAALPAATQPLTPLDRQYRPLRPWLGETPPPGGDAALAALVSISDSAAGAIQQIEARPLAEWQADDLSRFANLTHWYWAVIEQLHGQVVVGNRIPQHAAQGA